MWEVPPVPQLRRGIQTRLCLSRKVATQINTSPGPTSLHYHALEGKLLSSILKVQRLRYNVLLDALESLRSMLESD